MKIFPPGAGLARTFVLIGITALLMTPTLSIGGGANQELRNILQDISRNYSFQVRDIQGQLRENLRTLPRETQVSNFDTTLQLIGDWGYDAWYDYKTAYWTWSQVAKMQIQNTTLDLTDPGSVLGTGSCADRAREAYIWEERAAFAKWLEMTLRRTRWGLVQYNPQTDRDDRIPVTMSVLVFPRVRDTLIFTPKSGPPPMTGRVSINGIVAASYTIPGQTQANGSAYVYGTSAADAMVDLTADGPGGPFNTAGMADSNGRWSLGLTGLQHGYYQVQAQVGATLSPPREFGLHLNVKF